MENKTKYVGIYRPANKLVSNVAWGATKHSAWEVVGALIERDLEKACDILELEFTNRSWVYQSLNKNKIKKLNALMKSKKANYKTGELA